MTFAPADKAPRRKASGGSTRKPSGGASRAKLPSLRKELDMFVVSINELLHAFDPLDALDNNETAALVDALDKESQKNARLHRGLQTLLTLGSGGGLGFVVGIIVGRRLARRRLFGSKLSQAIDQIGGVAIAGVNVEPSEAQEVMDALRDMMSGQPPTNGAATT